MNVISAGDEMAIRSVTDTRNNIAHEMLAMVGDAKWPDLAKDFATTMALVQKIEKWWILNVEIGTDPDINANEIDEDKIVSGPSWVMHLLAQVALGVGDEAWKFHQKFEELRTSDAKRQPAGAEEAKTQTHG